jgi:hypothetical protein
MLPRIFPDYAAPIVSTGADGVRELVMARWGMLSPAFALQGKKVDRSVTNVRNTASPHWLCWLVPAARSCGSAPKQGPLRSELSTSNCSGSASLAGS